MKKEEETVQREKRALRFAGAAFVFFAAATGAFIVTYSAASADHSGDSQVAAVAAPVVHKPDPFASVTLIGKSAIVIDTTTGRTLYSMNPDVQLPLASITKVAMALAVSEALSPNDEITIPYDTPPSSTAQALSLGEVFNERDLMNFTLTASSNEGADILAAAADANLRLLHGEAPEGSATLWRMNDLARQLGLTNTFFLNVNGLDISTTQSGAYSSARDVALLLTYAASTSPSVFSSTRESSVTITAENGARAVAINTNDALPQIPGLVMGKTGYTDLAGGNLGVVFDAAGHRIVAVVLGSTFDGRFTDIESLVSAAEKAVDEEGK